MATKKPATIAEYIQGQPKVAQPHLRRIHAILAKVAPEADQVIKWGNPFFVEPRFLFAFGATKNHVNFAVTPAGFAPFAKELAKLKTTKHYLQLPYDQPL